MPEVVFIRDLPCYEKEHGKKDAESIKNRKIDLSCFPKGNIREQMCTYLYAFAGLHSCRSTVGLFGHLRSVAAFLEKSHPDLDDITDCERDELLMEFKTWSCVNHLPSEEVCTGHGKTYHLLPRHIRAFEKVLLYFDRASGDECFRIYIRDLPCKKKTERDKQFMGRYIDLSCFLQEQIRGQMKDVLFILAQDRSCASMVGMFTHLREIAAFINEEYPKLCDISSESQDALLHSLKKWRLAKGLPFMDKTDRLGRPSYSRCRSAALLSQICEVFQVQGRQAETRDIWDLEKIGFPVRNNPIHVQKTLNFTGIPQMRMRREIQDVCSVLLRYRSVSRTYKKLLAGQRFCCFLSERYPGISSFTGISRIHIEEYLLYLRTETDLGKSLPVEISCLKGLFEEMGRMWEIPAFSSLFRKRDIPKKKQTLYKAYSDAEIEKLNRCIMTMQPQVARALLVHELLGLRISDTLTLKQDCMMERDKNIYVRVTQVKTGKDFTKPINETCAQLLEASIRYTKETYGRNGYIFVKPGDPDMPMTYNQVYSNLRTLIYKHDLRDDHGKMFSASTHIFRHTYGRRLADLGADDEVIARLLGHTSLCSVRNYRRVSPGILAAQTRKMRSDMDAVIKDIVKEWPDDEI